MDNISAFELNKHNQRTNETDRLHKTPIVSYGRIIEVIDVHTVIVEAAVKTTLSIEVFTVPLLSLSSGLFELNVKPQIGDRVLLLFLQKYDAAMFDADDVIENSDATGYNSSSAVGILLSTFKNFADTVIRLLKDGDTSVMEIDSGAKWHAVLNSSAGMTFCRAVVNSGDERIISILFGEGRPLMERFLSKVTREYGFWKDQDGKLARLDAAVVERYSEYAPITKDIQGKQTIKIGVNDDGEDTEAPVKVTLGANADISVESASGINVKTSKAVSVEAGSTIELKNTKESLGALMGDLIDKIISTVSSAVIGTPNGAGSITIATTDLLAVKTRCKALLK